MFSPPPYRLALRFVRLILLVICCTTSALSQSQITGRLTGTITDEKGAVIAGAQVVAVSQTTNDERTVVTDAAGNYNVSLLLPGAYRVTMKAAGFNSAVFDSVQVVITETTTINVKLTVADLKVDPINVRTGLLSQSDGPQLGRVVNSRAVSELPLATRNFTQILALSPGTSAVLPDNTALGRNSLNVSVNGARVTQNNFQLNGIDANNIGTNAAGLLPVPAPETIQEFTVQTSLYDATFGRGGGGSVQAVTRTGSNEFHGAAYEYFRDDSLNANNPFLKAAGVERPTLSRNVFGGMLGGPVRKDRSFFFLSYQGTRERNGASSNSLSPSIFIAPGLTDDRSQQRLLATFRPRLPNGTPATSINPVALSLLNARLPDGQFVIPTPQVDGRYSGSIISTYRENQFNANVDHRINDRNWLAAKFFFSNSPHFLGLPNGGANVPGFGADQSQNNRVIAINDIHSFSPRLLNEARVGHNFIRSDVVGLNPIRDSDLGIRRANAAALPGLGLIRIGTAGTNALAIGNSGANVDTRSAQSSTTVADVLSINRGEHSFRLGGEILFYEDRITTNNNRRGQIVFQTFNNFLLGLVNNSTYGDGIDERTIRTSDYSFFFHDDWRLSRKLTLNLGLRYELDLPPYEKDGLLSTFDPSLYQPRMAVDASGNPIGPPAGGFVQPGNVIPQYDLANVPNVSNRMLTSIDPNNFAPRFGFAYAPLASGRLVIRGGYGIFHSRSSLIYLIVGVNAPPLFAIRRSAAGGTVPFADPYVVLPSQDQFPIFVNGVSLAGQVFDRQLRTPYVQQYNTSVQYELSRDMLFEVTFAGTRGLNLIRSVGINQARLASPQSPIINAVNGRVITTNTADATNVSLRAPYQGVEVGGFLQIQTTAQSTYNSLQLSLTRRFAKGVQGLAAYTFGKSIDNSSGTNGGSADAVRDTAIILGNQLDNRAHRGLSDFDRRHRLVVSFLWDLPQSSFATRSKTGRLLIADWQVAGVVTAMSGLPIDITDGGAGSFYGLNSGNNPLARPSWAPGATLGTASSNVPAGYFFNPFAFVRPVVTAGRLIPSSNGAALADGLGTDLGNVGRNVLRGPRQANFDFSIIKRFRLGEQKNLEFRAEFFNVFNHVNFDNPISNLNVITSSGGSLDGNTGRIINPGDFGRIVSTSNNPRLVQLALRVNF
ncbi:MAG TPA: carboxypeptidase-like regulatory domain-containing protein [Pyrinomonadaceae bacterium]|nr:carboxypeptidase-like regulatory domain-containing protein [Pyrinomonadaceae bacterium]